jgi:hypothetical protein
MEEFRKPTLFPAISIILVCTLIITLSPQTTAWSNGGYSADPSNPDYGTHDWIAQHALDWLPDNEKRYISDNLNVYLYGTELPDNGGALDGIGDSFKHHVYFNSTGALQDNISASRAREEYNEVIDRLTSGEDALAAKQAGIMSHYVVDLAVFGHVMGSSTDWGSEAHHSDYENYVRDRTTGYLSSEFDPYLVFDGDLVELDAYDATLDVAFVTTFGDGGDVRSCTWMDGNYDWSDGVFRDSAGASLNLAVNKLADVLHGIAVEVGDVYPPTVLWTTPGDLEEDVSVGEDVVVAFSEAVDASTFGFTVSPQVGGWSWTWSDGGTKVTGSHLDLDFSEKYAFTVTGAEDLSGNALVGAPYSWSWTTEEGSGTIFGTVKDGEGIPIGSATVELRKADNDDVVDVGMTDGDGVFGFSDVAFGSLRMVVSGVGFVDHETEAFTLSGSARTFDAGDIVLEERSEAEMRGSVDWMWVGVSISGGIAIAVFVLIMLGRRKRTIGLD